MGTILARKRSNGSTAYMGKIVMKQQGKIIHKESKTFDRRAAAAAWIAKRETEIRENGPEKPRSTVTLAQAIDTYTDNSKRALGRTKTQVLRSIKQFDIAGKPCDQINSQEIVAFAQELAGSRHSSTVGTYLSHLASVINIANPAWGYPLDPEAMRSARIVLTRLGVISRSDQRDRRPTLDELDRIMTFLSTRNADLAPMLHIIAFAIFSTRRQDEISRMTWADLDEQHSRIMVRNMKDPSGAVNNDVLCDLPPEAMKIIQAMPKIDARIFPYKADTIGTAWRTARDMLGIFDLRFHDLRHEGISRLFELGWTIPHVAAVSGHRSWQNLQRYTHIRQRGDKYEGWKWLDIVTTPPPAHKPQPGLCSGEPSTPELQPQ